MEGKIKLIEKVNVKELILKYTMMLIGCFFYGLSSYAFLVPNNIVAGGLSGLSTAIYYLWGVPVGYLFILFNIPILLCGLKAFGWKFTVNCFITTTVLGLVTELLQIVPPLTANPLLASMYGGVVQGIGIGIFIKYKVSSGGTELLGRLTKRLVPVGSIAGHVAFFDGVIVIFGAFVTKSIENVLYALILLFISSKISDVIVYGFSSSKMCFIISQNGQELAQKLIENSPRGVTLLNGKGVYSGQDKSVLLTCVKNGQVSALRKQVKLYDETAFVVICDSKQVFGNGFTRIDDDNV